MHNLTYRCVSDGGVVSSSTSSVCGACWTRGCSDGQGDLQRGAGSAQLLRAAWCPARRDTAALMKHFSGSVSSTTRRWGRGAFPKQGEALERGLGV